jgi:serine/threonine-protein kinase
MATETPPADDRERLLDEVLKGYLRAVDEGHAPDPGELLLRHPDLAEDIERFLAAQEVFTKWAEPVRQVIPPAPEPRFSPGGAFGDYDLLDVISRGGMGVVFRARQRSVPRVVALKVIRSGPAAAPDDVRRFRNEVETVALLDHPNVVPILDAGEFDGALYFAMRLYEGGSLAERLDRFAADPRAAAALVAAVARAVHFAHQRGVLHRDLKPSNVLLDGSGCVAVADFGLAKRLGADGDLTQ